MTTTTDPAEEGEVVSAEIDEVEDDVVTMMVEQRHVRARMLLSLIFWNRNRNVRMHCFSYRPIHAMSLCSYLTKAGRSGEKRQSISTSGLIEFNSTTTGVEFLSYIQCCSGDFQSHTRASL